MKYHQIQYMKKMYYIWYNNQMNPNPLYIWKTFLQNVKKLSTLYYFFSKKDEDSNNKINDTKKEKELHFIHYSLYKLEFYYQWLSLSQDFEVDVSCRVVEIKRVIMDAFDLEGIDEYGLCFGLKDRGSSLFKPSVCSCFYFLPRLASKD